VRILSACSKEDVYGHWNQVDSFKNCLHAASWRKRIWSPLPTNTRWFNSEIEVKDLERIFIISSDEWSSLDRSFKLISVAERFEKKVDSDIACRILDLVDRFKEDAVSLDRKLTMVSASLKGNFTIIDGNKRAVALHKIGKLAGNRVYLGISANITEYRWAKQAMHSQDTGGNLCRDAVTSVDSRARC